MLLTVWDELQRLLGVGIVGADLDSAQMVVRTFIVYIVSLFLVRIGSRRLLSQATAFDVVIAIMLGSIMSRAINGSAPVITTVFAGLVLVGIHWLFAFIAVRTSLFGPLVKGEPVVLIRDGELQEEAMSHAGITKRDLNEALRLQSGIADFKRFKRATMERNGSISAVPYDREPQILQVAVKEGVQNIRIKIE